MLAPPEHGTDAPASARPVVRLVIPSIVTQLEDGRWHGTYPSTGIDVTGDTKPDVIERLARALTALRETEGFARVFEDAMRGTAVPAGWLREEITREGYEQRLRGTFGG